MARPADEARQLTVADFEYADDPKELLDKLPSVRVHRWLPWPGSEGY